MSGWPDMSAPPPLPQVEDASWRFRTVRPDGEDVDLVHRWMNEPDVARFWRQDWTRSEWEREIADQLAGTFSHPCLVELDGRAVAYLELYRAGGHEIGRHYAALQGDVGVHVAIGDTASRGRGHGTSILATVAAGLLADPPGCTRVLAEPDARNAPAVGAFRKAGFRVLGEITLPHKTAALMARTADGAALPALRVADRTGHEVR